MRITRWAAVAAVGVAAGAIALAGPVQAQDGGFPAVGFSAFDWPDPASGPVASAASTVTGDTIALTKTDGAVGTDATTTNLGLSGDQLTVDYALGDGVETAAGAVRFFAYSSTDANVSAGGQAPNVSAIADAASGTLTLDLAGGAIGTVGVTYDASNPSTGTVTFTGMELDGEAVSFLGAPDPDPTPTKPADPDPEPECVDVNTASAEELTMLKHIDDVRAAEILELRPFSSIADLDRVDGLKAGGPRLAELVKGGDGFLPLCDIAGGGGGGTGDGDEKGLPVTGSPVALFGAGGAALLGLGGGAYLLSRRRRVTFTS